MPVPSDASILHGPSSSPSRDFPVTSSRFWTGLGWFILVVQGVRALLYPWMVASLENTADGQIYMVCAKELMGKGFFSWGAFWGCYWPPMWIICLSVLYRFVGIDAPPPSCYFITRIVNVVLWFCILWLLYRLAKRLLDDRVAFWAVVLASFDSWFYFIKFTGYELLLIALTLGLALAAERLARHNRIWDAAWMGLVGGFAVLTQGKMLLVIAAFLAVHLLLNPSVRSLGRAALTGTITLAMLFPWTWHNWIVTSGRFVLLTSNAGINLWQAQNPGPLAGMASIVPLPVGFRPGPHMDEEAQFRAAAWQYVCSDPRRVFLWLVPLKIYLVWELGTWHHVIRFVLMFWGLLRGLAMPETRRNFLFLAVVPVSMLGIHSMVGIGDSRYRYPASPFAAIVDTWVLLSLAEWARLRFKPLLASASSLRRGTGVPCHSDSAGCQSKSIQNVVDDGPDGGC